MRNIRNIGEEESNSSPPKAGVARQRVGPTSLGIASRACTILNKLLLFLLLLRISSSLLSLGFSIPTRHLQRQRRGEGPRGGGRERKRERASPYPLSACTSLPPPPVALLLRRSTIQVIQVSECTSTFVRCARSITEVSRPPSAAHACRLHVFVDRRCFPPQAPLSSDTTCPSCFGSAARFESPLIDSKRAHSPPPRRRGAAR